MIKTKYATIVNIGCNPEKPYYVIRYRDEHDEYDSEGFGSYYLPFVLEWLRTEFEIIQEK